MPGSIPKTRPPGTPTSRITAPRSAPPGSRPRPRPGSSLLGHLNPRYDAARLERMLVAAMQVFPRTRLADDFATFEIQEPAEEKAAPVAAADSAAASTVETSDEGFTIRSDACRTRRAPHNSLG